MSKISVVVIARNEEDNIGDCLRSASWADEIIVVDDRSTDRTVQVAESLATKVFSRATDNEGSQRNWAYDQARGPWVLSLDADERVSRELGEEIRQVIAANERFNGYAVPIRTYIGRRWIRYGGWYPAGKLRLFRKDKFRYEEAEVHPRIILQGESRLLRNDIVHYGYRDIHHFLAALNSQTTKESQKWFREKRKVGYCKILRKIIDRFLKRFVLKKGFKDGFMGVFIAAADSLYQYYSFAKYWEMKKNTEGKEKDAG